MAAAAPPEPAVRAAGRPTDAWAPGYTLAGDEGTVTTDSIPDGEDPDWATIFQHWGLDPQWWTVVDGSLRVNAWQMHGPDGELRIHRQFKATIRRRTVALGEVWKGDDTLLALARWKRKPLKRADRDGDAWIVNPADWQVGGHGGHQAFEQRFTAAMDDLVDNARERRRQGCTELVVGFLGDMGEGVTGNYPGQEFEVDLDRNDQTRIVAGCELTVLRELAPFFDRTTAVAVPGNHTRNAKDYNTGDQDVADMASFEWAASMLTYAGEAERFGIRFVMPEKVEGTLVARVEAAGTRILYAHGHKAKGSADKLRSWWRDVSFTRWGDADATDHLITGHRHHVHIEECSEDRWLFVCPTLGGPSTWFHSGGGPTSGHGVMHYVTRDRSVRLVDIAGARATH